MEKRYVLALVGPLPINSADTSVPQQRYIMTRVLQGDAPPWGTSVCIHADDPEWIDTWVIARDYRQPHDLLLEIHLTLEWEGNPDLDSLAVLRAVEILRDAGWKHVPVYAGYSK